jgi:hypothetical protein
MISETNLSKGYSTFWKEFTPWLNSYSQQINKIGSTTLFDHIEISEETKYRSINGVLAFNSFRKKKITGEFNINEIFTESKNEIENFPRSNFDNYILDELNKEIINKLVKRMSETYQSSLEFEPLFAGCGFLANCKGDIIENETLIEIKTGDRNLLSSDIKQLLIYYALNEISGNKYRIDKLQYFNPRTGVIWENDIESVIKAISTITSNEFCHNLEYFLIALSSEIQPI